MFKQWWSYFIGTGVAVLQAHQKPTRVEMTILVERGLKIGLVDPDEQAHKMGISIPAHGPLRGASVITTPLRHVARPQSHMAAGEAQLLLRTGR